MSATSTPGETYTCRHCNGSHDATATVGGSFCSERCLYRHRGEKALRRIAADHRYCATCFRQLKTVDRPDDRVLEDAGVSKLTRSAFVGLQSRTEHAVDGVDEREPVGAVRDRPIKFTRTSCECGTVDPSDRHAVLRELDPKQTVQSLWACLVALERDGTLQKRPSKDAYLQALRETDLDWAYAVGRALYADG